MDEDLILAQLISSRLCHDLVGPAGGVAAGLELFREQGAADDPNFEDKALDLAARSAGEVTRRLAFYRAAFGYGAGNDGTVALAAVRENALQMFTGDKVTIAWPENAARELPAAGGKLLLILVLIAADALLRGGEIAVGSAELEEGTGVAIAINGTGAEIKPEIRAALEGTVSLDELSAHSAPGYLARRLAQKIGAVVEIADGAGGPQIAVLLPLPLI